MAAETEKEKVLLVRYKRADGGTGEFVSHSAHYNLPVDATEVLEEIVTEITYINTLDGRTLVEWWSKERFQGRDTKLISATRYKRIPIPDNVVLCDFCNTRITEFPVPVVGTYALCKTCLEDMQKE